jgi:hypothetical protein
LNRSLVSILHPMVNGREGSGIRDRADPDVVALEGCANDLPPEKWTPDYPDFALSQQFPLAAHRLIDGDVLRDFAVVAGGALAAAGSQNKVAGVS